MKLLLLIFLGTITLIRRAQKNIFTRLEANPSSLLGILPQDEQGLNLRSSVHEGNIQRVISILQGNIKQWSFIEAQLLEPNVNLAMPEIFIPLKHLTTTLEILGNIFFMKNDYDEARKCLERACPLMELLPSSILESFESAAAGQSGGDGLINEFNFVSENEIDETIREQIILNNQQFVSNSQRNHPSHPNQFYHSTGKNYAADCFELLRNVYVKLYGLNTTTESADSDEMVLNSDEDRILVDSTEASVDSDSEVDEESNFSGSYDDLPIDEDDTTGNEIGVTSMHEKFIEIETKIEELRSPFQHLRSELQMVQDRTSQLNVEKMTSYTDADLPIIEEIHDENDEESSQPRGKIPRVGRIARHNGEKNKLSRLQKQLGTPDGSNSQSQFSESSHDLSPPRSSFLEILKRHFTNFFSASYSPSSAISVEESDETDMEAPSGTLSFMQDDEDELHSDFSSSSAFRGLSGSATSIIASDLEVMLRKFVREDEEGRREIFFLAKKYYDDLEMNFPQMDENEYSANMDLGTVYLEIMGRVVEEGFGFVGPELEKWQDIGHSLVTKHIQPMSSPHSSFDSSSDVGEASSFGVGIIWEIDPETGKKQEFAVELDGSYFDAFTLQERNRLLVLSAFDIALNLEPYEQFDLSLGFGLGILDNDRSRQREHASLSFYHQTTPNQQPHLLNVQKPVQSTHVHVPQSSKQKKGRKEDPSLSPASAKGPKRSKRSNGSKTSTIPSSTSSVASGVSSSKVENELEPSLFMDQTSATLEIPAALRSSVPMIKIENDWTFFLLMSFLAFTLIVVYIAYYQELLKRRLRQRSSSTRNQKKVGANASLTNGVNTSETGYGFYDIVCFMMMDWFDFIVPIFALLLAKVSSLSHDLYQSMKIALSRFLVQVTLLLRERREMIFHSTTLPTAANHVAPGIPNPSTLNSLSSSSNKLPLKKLPSASNDTGNTNQARKPINPPVPLPKPQLTNRPPSPHPRPQASVLPQPEIQSKTQSWQQIIAHETTSSSSTSSSSVTEVKADSRASHSVKSHVVKEEKISKKKGSQSSNHQNNGNTHSIRKIDAIGVKNSSTDLSNADISSDSDVHLSDEDKSKRAKKTESLKGSKASSVLSNRVENTSVEEIVVSEDFMLSQPEQYEALVSSLLAEGQWKEAKKKAPKKSNQSTATNTSTNSHAVTFESNREKDKKNRSSISGKLAAKPVEIASSKRSNVGNGTSGSTVSTSSSSNGVHTSPSSNQAKIDEALSAEKRATSLTLNLESMLPPAVLEHKPSSLPLSANPKSWKSVATRNTGSVSSVGSQEKHDTANSLIDEQMKGGKKLSVPTPSNVGETTSTPTIPPELPAMPALLPTTTVTSLGLGSRNFPLKDDVTNQLPLSFSTNGLPPPSLQTNPINLSHAPPPGLLNIRVQPASSSSGYPLQLGAYSNPSFNPANGSLLSSLLGSTLTDEVREGSLLTGAGVLNEEDGDSNELLRGMLDDILRPASPPLMDRLFSAKTISQDVLPYSTSSSQPNTSSLFPSSDRTISNVNSTSGLFFHKSSMEIISDLSPDAPVFQPNPTQPFTSANLHQQFAVSLTNNLLNDDYWSFPGIEGTTARDYANPSDYHLTSQIDDVLSDAHQFPENSSPPPLYPQQR